MKKRIGILVLPVLALVAFVAHSETERYRFRVDESLTMPVSAEIALAKVRSHEVLQRLSSRRSPSLRVRSHVAFVFDEQTQQPLYNKNGKAVMPIASITKLMTAMVFLDANLPMDEEVSVEEDDLNKIKRAKSRLRVGMTLTRREMLRLALMASENRAALALARSYPGGPEALVAAMNAKARDLGMDDTRFFDPTGLDSDNVSTAQDLVKMVAAASYYPLIAEFTTTASHSVDGLSGRAMRFSNTNPLVRNASWDIGLSKTGFINEAGKCLVMQATINHRPVIIVLLDSWGRRTRIGDANRIKRWMERADALDRTERRG